MQRTLAIIKPDAVERRLVGQILARIEGAGFSIRAMRLQHLTKREAEGFYAVHRERPFFGGLTEFMSSGPSVLLALEATDAIAKWRALMGATDPAKADAATIRFHRAQRHARVRCSRDGGFRSGVLLPGAGAVVIGSGLGAWDSRPDSPEASMGRILIVLGLVVAAIGLLITLGLPIGRLPGDITIRRGNFTFYFPLATSIVASILVTLLFMFLTRK
jgi:nucleoside-diphosphate kinase